MCPPPPPPLPTWLCSRGSPKAGAVPAGVPGYSGRREGPAPSADNHASAREELWGPRARALTTRHWLTHPHAPTHSTVFLHHGDVVRMGGGTFLGPLGCFLKGLGLRLPSWPDLTSWSPWSGHPCPACPRHPHPLQLPSGRAGVCPHFGPAPCRPPARSPSPLLRAFLVHRGSGDREGLGALAGGGASPPPALGPGTVRTPGSFHLLRCQATTVFTPEFGRGGGPSGSTKFCARRVGSHPAKAETCPSAWLHLGHLCSHLAPQRQESILTLCRSTRARTPHAWPWLGNPGQARWPCLCHPWLRGRGAAETTTPS